MKIPEHLRKSVEKRLLDGCVPEPNTGCWLWTKSIKHFGYGAIGIGGGWVEFTHRASYIIFKGEIPDGIIVRHKCDTPSCINPEHLILGTIKDNSQDMVDRRRHKYHKINICKNGHEFNSDNTEYAFNRKMGKKQRVCKTCKEKAREKWRSKQPKKPPYKKPLKDFCKYGHKMAGENIILRKSGIRLCSLCQKRRTEEKKIKRKLGILKT